MVTWTDQAVLQTLLFMLGLSLVSGLLGLPFDWYATFILKKIWFQQNDNEDLWIGFTQRNVGFRGDRRTVAVGCRLVL